VDKLEVSVKDAVPAVSKIFIEAQSLKNETRKIQSTG
jgi:hypothetical protein